MKIRNTKISLEIIVLFVISLLGFYFLNRYTHIAIDDFLYKYIVDIDGDSGIRGARVESISDLITSQYNHYFIQNGRLLIHGIVQLFLMSENKLWFDIVNTLFFGMFQFLILKRSSTLGIINKYQYLLFLIFLWFIIPRPGQTVLWLTGSINYMWGMIIVLLFLDFFDKIHLRNLQVKNKYLLLLLVFGFLAGFTHEGITIGLSGALCIGILKNFKKYNISSLILIFGFLLGTFIMVLAPGNMIRFTDGISENYTIYDTILSRFKMFTWSTKYLSGFWLMITLFSVLFVKDRTGLKKVYREHELLLHTIFISFIFIFIAGLFDPRVYFGISVFSIMIIMSILQRYSKLFFYNKNKVVYIILFVFVIIEFIQVFSELRTSNAVIEKDEENWVKSEEKVFVLSENYKSRFALPGPGVHSDRYSMSNKYLSWYYGKEFIMFIPHDMYENVYKSNKFITSKSLLNTESLKNSSDSIKLYKTPNNKFLIYKVTESISKKILDGTHVEYKRNKLFKKYNSGYLYRIKSFLGANQNNSTETAACFVLPTPYGNYLILSSPQVIPLENIEEIIVYPSRNDTIPILSF
jgi:hypothetical protein